MGRFVAGRLRPAALLLLGLLLAAGGPAAAQQLTPFLGRNRCEHMAAHCLCMPPIIGVAVVQVMQACFSLISCPCDASAKVPLASHQRCTSCRRHLAPA